MPGELEPGSQHLSRQHVTVQPHLLLEKGKGREPYLFIEAAHPTVLYSFNKTGVDVSLLLRDERDSLARGADGDPGDAFQAEGGKVGNLIPGRKPALPATEGIAGGHRSMAPGVQAHSAR